MTEISSVSGLRGVREALERHDLRRWIRFVKLDNSFDYLRCYCGAIIREDSNEAMFGHIAEALSLPPSPQSPGDEYPNVMPARSGITLKEFIEYCRQHPQERFWQALRNWSEAEFIYADSKDTFYWQERRPPAGAQGQVQGVQARPQMSIGKNAAGEMHLSASGYCSTCNMLVEFGTDDCPHAKTMYGRAEADEMRRLRQSFRLWDGRAADVSSQAGQPPSETTEWRWLRLRGYLRQWLTPHHFEIAMDCLDKAEEAAPSAGSGQTMTNNQIKYMVNRFLSWRLPENFNPDAGISFKPYVNEHTAHPRKSEPVGTNLFDAAQAEEMIRYLVDGMSSAGSGQEGLREALRELLSKFECFAVRHMVSSDESELTGEFRWWPKRGNDAFITDERYRELAALLPPASEPPAEDVGDYSCVVCGFGMKEPCEHWKTELPCGCKFDGKKIDPCDKHFKMWRKDTELGASLERESK